MGIFNQRTKRTAALEEYAAGSGRKFQQKDDFGLIKYFGDFKVFRVGHSRRITHIQKINAEDHGECGIFDYTFVISTGNSHVPYRQSVYYAIDKRLDLPHFNMYPERWYHRIGKWFGVQDINFFAYPEFSGNFMLKGAEEEYIRALFDDPLLMDHFNRHPKWSVEGIGYYLIMYQHAKYQAVADLPAFEKIAGKLRDILVSRAQQLRETNL